MTRKTNTALIALLGTILMGLSTWVLITLIELQTIVAMLQTEILGLDKVIGRIYAHMDRLSNKWQRNLNHMLNMNEHLKVVQLEEDQIQVL